LGFDFGIALANHRTLWSYSHKGQQVTLFDKDKPMKPIKRQNKINQRELLELNRQARDWVLELHLYKALAQAIKPLQKQTHPQPIQVRVNS